MSNKPNYDAGQQKKFIDEEYKRVISYFDPNEWYEHRNLVISMKMMIEHLEKELKKRT